MGMTTNDDIVIEGLVLLDWARHLPAGMELGVVSVSVALSGRAAGGSGSSVTVDNNRGVSITDGTGTVFLDWVEAERLAQVLKSAGFLR